MRGLLIPLLALFAAAPVAAQQTQAFHSEAGYTVQIPAEWWRMPDSALREARQGARVAGDGFAIEAAYRVTRGSTFAMAWFDAGETMTRDAFVEEMTDAAGHARLQEGADLAGAGARMTAPIWDAENELSWTRAQKPPTAQGVTRISWSVFALHPNGRIVLLFSYTSTLGADEARMRSDLLRVVRSLRVG
jgi:hypothetical protein